MSFRRTFAEALAGTFRHVFADRPALSTLVLAVLLYSFFYPAAYQHQVADRMPVVAVDLDRSALSRQLLRHVAATQAVRIVGQAGDMPAAQAALGRLEADGILLIPADLQRTVQRGQTGVVALYGNGASSLRNKTVLAGLGGAVAATAATAAAGQGLSQGVAAPPPVAFIQRPLFNTREGYGSYVVPGVVVLILHQTLLIGVVLLAATRREQGHRRTPPAALLGTACAFVLIGCANALYCFGFMFWFHDYPRGGNLAGMLVATPLFMGAVVALALCVGSFFTVRERALQVLLPTSLPMFFLAGLSWPVEAIPAPLAWLAQWLPLTHGVSAMLKLNQFGAHLGEAAHDLLALAGLTLLYGGVAALRQVEWGAPAPASPRP